MRKGSLLPLLPTAQAPLAVALAAAADRSTDATVAAWLRRMAGDLEAVDSADQVMSEVCSPVARLQSELPDPTEGGAR